MGLQEEKALFSTRFRTRLDYWMATKQKSQDDFRKEAGIGSKNTVTSWKQGKALPHETQIEAICQIFGCDRRVFSPYFQSEKESITNADTEKRAGELELYAREKGLKESTYQHITHMPEFMRIFPFHGLKGLYGVNRYRQARGKTGTTFPLTKYQFEDHCGHRFMLNEQDIDFLLSLQGKSERMIRLLCLEEKEQIKMNKFRVEMEKQLRYYPEISRKEVEEKAEAVNVIEDALTTPGAKVSRIIKEIAGKNRFKPQIRMQEIEKAIYTARPSKKTIEDWYRMNGMTTAEIRDQMQRDCVKVEAKIKKRTEQYRKLGYIIPDGNRKENIH